MRLRWCFTAVLCLLSTASSRIHNLTLENDKRVVIDITSFGMYVGGYIHINMSVDLPDGDAEEVVLTMRRQMTAPNKNFFSTDTHEEVCTSSTANSNDSLCFRTSTAFTSCMNCTVGSKLNKGVHVTPSLSSTADAACAPAINRTSTKATEESSVASPRQVGVPLNGNKQNFSTSFNVSIFEESGIGLYEVFIERRCGAPSGGLCNKRMNLKISVQERNNGTYLSAGQIPLPYVYFAMAILFFLSGSAYWYIICRSREGIFKLHYMILAALYCKGLALLFHGVNYYYIGLNGYRETAWAVIYYITYLMRTVVLFLTILLVGTGWSYIKHVFSGKEKKLLLIALPLQVLAYVARVIIEETEEGEEYYLVWQKVVVVVDILCFAAILFPVIWSIRHLTEASETDGKAARNLAKLKIFRQYYILVIAYIYMQEIIITIMELAEPFQLEWLSMLTTEVTTFLFVMITAFKFRPASNNPYFRVPDDDDEEEVLTKSALLDTVTRVVKIEEGDGGDSRRMTSHNSGGSTGGPKQREASHEYD